MEKITIAELDIDVDKVLKSSARLKTNLDALKEANKELKSSGQAGSKVFVENDAKIRNLSLAYRQNQQVASALLAVNNDLVSVQNLEGKSVTQVRNERTKLIKVVNSVKGNTEEEKNLRNELNATIDKQTEFIRENSSEYNASKDAIGEYAQGIEKAIPANSILGQAISTTKDALNVVTPIYNNYSSTINGSIDGILNASKGTEGLSKAQKASAIATNVATNGLKLFRLALIGTGIGIILVALGSLVTFLGSTQSGIDKVNRVLKPLGVIFSRLQGVVQKFGEDLFKAISNPRDTIKKLGDLIRDNLITRFQALGRIIDRFKNLEFKGIGEDISQLSTGVEDFGKKARSAFGGVRDFVQDSLDIGRQLADLTIEIEESENRIILRRAELKRIIKEQNKIAENTTLSQQEREQAALRTIEASKELLGLEQGLLDLKIKQKTIENSLNDTSREDQKELNELIAQRTDKETEALELQTTQTNKLNTIRRDIASRRKREQEEEARRLKDQAIEEVENLKIALETYKETNASKLESDAELNRARIESALAVEEIIKDKALQIQDERLAKGLAKENEVALEKLRIENEFNARKSELEQEFFDQQEEKRIARQEADKERETLEEEARLELRQLKADDEVEFQRIKLEEERNQAVANAEKLGADTSAIEESYAIKRKQIDDAVAANKLEAASSIFGQLASLAGKETFIGKAAGIAQATIDTYVGANKALATLPPPFGAIAAGVTVASGLANVGKIVGINTKFRDGGLQEVGGKRHSSGGTKFYGEDGTGFEAERGELIGVMSRKASQAFMRFNNLFTNKKSKGGKYASGGAFSASSLRSVQSKFNTRVSPTGGGATEIDYDRLGELFKMGAESLPNPVVGVEEIDSGLGRRTQVISGANV